jgi:hypothetical protein
MAGKFPIEKAPERIDTSLSPLQTPSVGSFTGDAGAAAGRAGLAIVALLSTEKQKKVKTEAAVQKQIEKMEATKRKRLDTIASVRIKSLIRGAIDRSTASRSPDTTTWEPQLVQEIGGAMAAAESMFANMSPEERAILTAEIDSMATDALGDSFIAESEQEKEDARDAVIDEVTGAYTDGIPEDRQAAGERFLDVAPTLWDDAEAKRVLKDAIKAGQKARKQNTLDSWQDRIAVNPDTTGNLLEAELQARKTGKGVIPELTGEDIQSLLNTVTNRKTQLTAEAQAKFNREQDALENELHDKVVDPETPVSVTDIAKSNLTVDRKRRLEQDISDKNARDIANMWAIEDTRYASEDVNSILTSQESGITSINQARSRLYELARETENGRSVLSKGTFDKTMAKITKGGRDATDKFVAGKIKRFRNYLLGRLTRDEAALRVRYEAGTLTGTQRRQYASVGFLYQVNNHQLIILENSIDKRIRDEGIEDVSGNRAKEIAAEEWLAVKSKTLSDRIKEFTIDSGVNLTVPMGFSKSVWDNASPRERALIVQKVSEGYSNNEIEGALTK